MSEFGIKIKNYEAASIYEYQHGFRGRLDSTDAMLTNSLFYDFLVENGLNIYKEESTRDVICLAFSYKTKGYADMINTLTGLKGDDEQYNRYIESLISNVNANIDDCIEIKKDRLRELAYTDGVNITYRSYNEKTGVYTDTETIHYKMLYRTPGKAKKGTCMFIRDELYDKAHEFLTMGINLPDKKAPIIQMGAYSSLITSTIIGKVQIKPEQILVVEDIKSFFKTKVVTIKTDDQKQCYTEYYDGYELYNTVFDGQALIDYSIFPEWADGYILLRHHMTKCAAFNTNIELFMREHFGDEYDTAVIKDMWGRDVKVSDIKFITTDNALKWLNFNISFEYWADWVCKNDSMWGIVKTTHESKLGDVQRMSYQMINSLNLETMPEVVNTSVSYINKLKQDDQEFIEYLKKNTNFSNDYDVLIALAEHNPDFIYSDYYRQRKKKIIESYVLNFKSGRCIQNADNLTIVGSPYALLLHSVGMSIDNDPTFRYEEGTIQCWTERFEDGEYLAAFRSPFNSRNNMGYLHNTYHPYFDKYFKLGKLCIAINLIGTDFQDRENGLTKWVSVQECA